MTPEIKQRIQQIRQGKVPQGYKKTKEGIIPESWDVKPVEECIEEYKKLSNDIRMYTVYSSSRNGLIPQSDYYDKKEAVETNKGYNIVPKGYITYRHMSDDDIFHFNVNTTGASILVSNEYPVFTTNCKSNTYFLVSALNESKRFLAFCKMQKKGGTRTRLYLSNLKQYHLPLPPLPKQNAIAEILSTQDRIIELKEQLLAEKKRQKKYLMQQLLTGKRRLKGFKGEWKKIRAREMFNNISDKNHSGDLEVLSSTQDKGIMPRNMLDIDIKYDKQSIKNYKKVEMGDFVISLRSFQGGIEFSQYTGIVSPAYTVIRNHKPISNEYYKYYFKSNFYINRLQTAVYGIRDGKQISFDDFGIIELLYPPLPEQTAIAEILSTADREIELIGQSIEAEKRKKKSLMQLLLTGIVRVGGMERLPGAF